MSLTIKTNIASLIAQGSLTNSTNKLNQAIERMSTGSKINHASDNAANYSIATNMTTKINAYQVAEDNVSMGLDMLATTSDTLSTMSDKLAQIRALAVQAQNGTYGKKSLHAINLEAQALLDEIVRINETAQYNGIKLFSTGKREATNAGKDLKLNFQGFLKDVEVRDTSSMQKLSEVDETQSLAQGEYSVSTVDDLLKLDRMSKAKLVDANSVFVLSNDIDLKEYCDANASTGGWAAISVTGTFDGNGYTISNMTINRPSTSYVGLFASAKLVKNLKVENAYVKAASYAGIIAGQGVKASNCSVSGKISAGSIAGGILGYGYYVNVENCYANVDITGNNSVGGIYGWANYSEITSCFSEGSIAGNYSIGGICGASFDVYNSKSTVTVKGAGNVGGISGEACRTLSGNAFSGVVRSSNTKAGGIVGSMSLGYNISNCISEGKVYGNTLVGIIAGTASNSSSIIDCSYYSDSAGVADVVGDASLFTITNLTDLTIPSDYVLQVGINGDSKRSNILYSTYIEFAGLANVLSNGLDDESVLEKIDSLVEQVSLKQTAISSVQNRLESALEEISTQYENLVSSRSTLKDADIADVSSDYIKMQILQNASSTLLATANQTPALALQLL